MNFIVSTYEENSWLTAAIIGVAVVAALVVHRRALRQGRSPWLPVLAMLLIGAVVLTVMPFVLFLAGCARAGDCV